MSYIKIVDETKKCEVFLNENPTAEQIADLAEQGFVEGEWERAWDGFPYVKGYVPEKPVEAKQNEVRSIRNQYLEETDKYTSIPDFPISKTEKAKYKSYRIYLRDYTEQEDWWENYPLSFEEWKSENEL